MTTTQRTLNAVLVSCGSFNPITLAHIQMLAAARQAVEGLNNNKSADANESAVTRRVVKGFVSPVNDGYKKAGLAPFPLRKKICEAAFTDPEANPAGWISLHEWEGQQSEFVPTYLVMKKIWDELKERGGDGAVDELYFVCGGDLLESFYKPGAWGLVNLKKLVEEFKIVVISRPGSADPKAFIENGGLITNEEKWPGTVVDCKKNLGNFVFASICVGNECGMDVSSTIVRNTLKDEGIEAVRKADLVPAATLEVLAQQDFYPVKKPEGEAAAAAQGEKKDE